jgi:pimeloyl-ACP methyl ester carboxylesterase
MRFATKWQTPWTLFAEGIEQRLIRPMLIADQRVDVVRLGRGEPIVLVPGMAGSWKLLLPLADILARHFEVITYALRGDHVPAGSLDASGGRVSDIGEYAHDLANLIDNFELEAPTIFGISFGGAIALELAAEHPNRLGALIINGAEDRFRPTLGSTIARRVLERFPLPCDNRFVNQFFHLLYGAKPDPSPLADYVIDRIWETDQSVIADRLMNLDSFNVSDRLWRIDAPTLILAGAHDVVVPWARQRALADRITGARFETLENAGHVGFLTHRAEVVRSVRQHLRRAKQKVSTSR